MHKQAGLTLPSMLVVGLVALLLIKAAITVVPMYWDNRMLSTLMNNMESTTDLPATAQGLVKQIDDMLGRNNLPIPTTDAKVKAHSTGGFSLDWDYERRGNWFGNVDIVVRFNQTREFTK